MGWTPPARRSGSSASTRTATQSAARSISSSLDPDDLLDRRAAVDRSRRLRGRHVATALRRPGRVAADRGPAHGGRPAGRPHRAAPISPPTTAPLRALGAGSVDPRRGDRRARSSWSAPDDPAPRSSTSCSRSTPTAGRRAPGSSCTRARRSDPTPPRRATAGGRRPRVLGRPPARVRDDAPQRRRRAERVHLRHHARVPVRPVGRHLRGPDLRRPPRRRRPHRRLPIPPSRCSRPCNAANAARRWVLKAPSHLSQLRTLFEVYPDARVVQIHRDPLKSVPSTISLMGTIKAMRCEAVDVDTLVPWVSMGYAMMLDDTMDARAAGRAARRPVRRRAVRRPDGRSGRHDRRDLRPVGGRDAGRRSARPWPTTFVGDPRAHGASTGTRWPTPGSTPYGNGHASPATRPGTTSPTRSERSRPSGSSTLLRRVEQRRS